MARRYLSRPLPPPGRHQLPATVAHHLAHVMRVATGDRVRLFDGEGHEALATVICIERGTVTVEVEAAVCSDREPSLSLEVAFALPKGRRAEWLFEHGCEIGVAAFHAVWTERSTRPPRGRQARWDRIVAAACGQCDRSRLPAVSEPRSLVELLADTDLPRERYLAATTGTPLTAAQTNRALLLVGPEGGLTTTESDQLLDRGFLDRNLGPLTLRTETAVLVGATRLLAGG